MKIEINKNVDTKKATKLLTKLFQMNDKSEYDYLKNDDVQIGYNSNSGFNYVYLENTPSLCVCLNTSSEFCYVYNSSLDGLEFIKSANYTSLDKLENALNIAYKLDEKREDDYNNDIKKDKFITAMTKKGWELNNEN